MSSSWNSTGHTRVPPMTSLVCVAVLLLSRLSSAATSDCPSLAPALNEVAEMVAPEHLLQTGSAGDVLVNQAVQAICDETHARQALPNSCAPLHEHRALVTLRNRMVLDLAAQARRGPTAARAPELRAQVRLALAVVHMGLTERSRLGFLRGLRPSRVQQPVELALCGASSPLPNVPEGIPGIEDTLGQAGHLLEKLSLVTPQTLDNQRTVMTGTLQELGRLAPNQALSAQREAALASLVAKNIELQTIEPRLQAAAQDGAALRDLVLVNLQQLLLALQLLAAPPVTLPSEGLPRVAQVLAAGHLTQLAQIAHVPIPTQTIRAVERIRALLRAETPQARERFIRREILGLEPWPADFLVDAHLGALVVSGDTYKLAGSLLLGYNGGSFGVALRGNTNSYDLSNAAKIDTTTRYAGNIEAWIMRNPTPRIGIEGRMVLGGQYNDTTVTDNVDMLAERSTLGRASLLAGLRYQQTRVALGLWLGGGVQFDRLRPSLMSGSNATMINATSDTINGYATARLRGQYHLLPDLVTLRLAAGSDYYHLARTTVTTTLGGSLRVENSVMSATHVDAYG